MKHINRRYIVFLSLLLSFRGIKAFLPPTRGTLELGRYHPQQTSLAVARKGKKTSGPSPRKASPKKPQKKSASPPALKAKKSTPPWQVMSAKEAQQNVQKEIERRQKIKQGASTNDPSLMNSSTPTISKDFLTDTERKLISWKRFNPDKTPDGMKFVGAYLDKRLPPRLGVPEIAFLGRSNVGKSSLLNKLSSFAKTSRDEARVGKTPGATASVNLYTLVDNKERPILGWADLPGFGYAKLSKDVKEAVQEAAENYLGKREELMLGVLLVDIRRTPSDDDRAVLAALYDMGVPLVVVATKMDKVSSNELEGCLVEIRNGLGLPDNQPLAVSSTTGEGCRNLWRIILEACEGGVAELASKYEGGRQREDEFDDVEAFVDDDDIAYDQGFDWVHGMADFVEDEEFEEGGFEFSDEELDEYDSGYDVSEPESFQSLKKRARDLERRREL